MKEQHKLAGKTVSIKSGSYKGDTCRVEDWAERLYGDNPFNHPGNPAVLVYAMRAAKDGCPIDLDVVGCKINGMSHLCHNSELGDELDGIEE